MILNTLNEHSFLKLNYEQTINEIKIKNDKSIIYDIKEYFESIDLEIRNSKWRKANGWIIHGTRQRQILTTHGLIIFMRTVYKNKFTKKYAILADPYLKIEKYEKISKDFKFKVLSVIEGGERQKDIIKMTNNFISQSSVSRIINYYDLKKGYENCINISMNNISDDDRNFKYVCDVTNQNNVYIDIDDTFTTLKCNNKKTKYRIRIAIVRTGNDYGVLMNKRVFIKMCKLGTSINTEKYLNWLMSQISMTYGDIKYKQLFVCGDGAPWIKNIAKDLNALFILDKFHLFQVLRRCFSYRKKDTANYHIYNFLARVIKSDHDINSAIIVLQDLLKNTSYWQNEYDKENVREALNYIKNNYSGIDIWKRKDICTGCYAESNISHLIKSVKGYGAKIYNVKTFTNLLYLKLAIVNKVKLIDFIKSETEEEFNILISKNKDFEFLDDKKYKHKNISIPILNYKDTVLKIKLKTIIYKY